MNPVNNQNVSSYAENQSAAFGQQPVGNDIETYKQMAVRDLKVIENLVKTMNRLFTGLSTHEITLPIIME